MRFALFANFENPFGDAARALAESVAGVCLAEELGFDEAWITEHHFNRFSVSASIFPLLAFLAARTQRIRLGSGAVLLPFHHPVRVAEDAATLDALSGGRLMLGVARGGPFPDQFRHFNVDPQEGRGRTLEAVQLVERLLAEEEVSHDGAWHRLDAVTVHPRPVQRPVPIWLASLTPESVALAVRRGYGLMGPSPAPAATLRPILDAYRASNPTTDRPFVLSRFFLCDSDHGRAIAEATPFIREFATNMGAAARQMASQGDVARPFGQPPQALGERSLLANALVGDPVAVAEQIVALRETLGPGPLTLMLKPATYDPATARRSLRLFSETVRHRVQGPSAAQSS
jgi:alkanesulfonate monooxygenase SsuD/methylene tetrahydromethanopterin reductase-like flavin-dependent oxidoreductase (luciferase family)